MIPASRFRLTSSVFQRTDDNAENKVKPNRIIFLSVEGAETERDYFCHLNRYLNETVVQIEVLNHHRKDGLCAPEHVLDLLEEYINIRNGELLPKELPKKFADKYSKEEVELLLKEPKKLRYFSTNSC